MTWNFHPKPKERPCGCKRLDGRPAKYSIVRYGDTIEIEGKPIGTITKIGRKFWDKNTEFGPLSYSYGASFPESFKWMGALSDMKARIGNSVPPNLMRAIAGNIREAPFMKGIENPTVVSTFAGCGGSSLGYQLAGFHELLAVEWEQNAVDTFRLNFPDVPVYHGDITKLTGAECMKLAGIGPRELDVFDGSPPCQGFSTAGKRKYDDPRNSLFKEYARLIKELQPKAFVMENVTGMVKGYMKQAYLAIIKTLRECGYKVKGEVLNAMYFNVPQSRERVIIIGVRNDLEIEPSFPQPQTKPITAKQIIAGCFATRSQTINPWIESSKNPATICKTEYSYQTLVLTDFDLKESEIKNTWQSYRVLKGLQKKKHFGLVRLNPNKVSPTITKDCGNSTTGIIHPYEIRKLTIPEIKRIGGFPDEFKLIGSFKQKWARIGNSVPPNFMKAIAEHIKINILDKAS